MNKLRFLFILMLLLGIAASVFAQEEIEVGDSVDGEENDDAVEYELFLEEGQTVIISVESDDFDTYLELYDEDGDFLASNDDGGDGTNSQLVYVAEDSAAVIISVRGFGSDGPGGDYTLTVEESDVVADFDGGELAYGDSVEVEPDGALSVTFTFEGTEGDVINLTVISADSEDTRLTLYYEGEDEIISDDDSAGYPNPALRRFELPDTGSYEVVVTSYSAGSPIFGDLEVTLEQSELLSLNDGPQTLVLSDEISTDVLVFETERRESYIVTVTLDDQTDSSVYLRITEEDEFYANTSLNFAGVQAVTFVFEADESGRAMMELEFYGFDEEIEVTVEIEPLGQ